MVQSVKRSTPSSPHRAACACIKCRHNPLRTASRSPTKRSHTGVCVFCKRRLHAVSSSITRCVGCSRVYSGGFDFTTRKTSSTGKPVCNIRDSFSWLQAKNVTASRIGADFLRSSPCDVLGLWFVCDGVSGKIDAEVRSVEERFCSSMMPLTKTWSVSRTMPLSSQEQKLKYLQVDVMLRGSHPVDRQVKEGTTISLAVLGYHDGCYVFHRIFKDATSFGQTARQSIFLANAPWVSCTRDWLRTISDVTKSCIGPAMSKTRYGVCVATTDPNDGPFPG